MRIEQSMRRHVIYAALVRLCLPLYEDTLRAICDVWQLEDRQVVRLGIVSAPTTVSNLIACDYLAHRFGDLSDVEGFYQLDGCWRLDLDEKLARRGLILSVRDSRMRIIALRVFRHVRDKRSFILRTRT